MTTKQLRYFLDLYRCASITKASQNHYVSRSSLVSSIEALEKEFGKQLLHRSHSGIAPTEFGLEVIEAARQILDIYDGLMDKASAAPRSRSISVSGSHLPFIPVILSRFLAARDPENLQFFYMEKRRCRVFRDVLEDHAEIGIISAPTNSRETVDRFFRQNALDYTIVQTGPLSCLVGKDNPLCQNGAEQISVADLAAMYRIRYHDTEPMDAVNTLMIPSAVLPAKGDLHVEDRSSLHTLLEDLHCYSPCPSYPGEYNPPNVRSLQIHDYPSTFDIIWFRKSRRKLNPLAKDFLGAMYDALGAERDPSLF